ncbi:cholinesterase 1-like [Physella acuta]|uniref:cholinesterase 1-like n=1 Tax=Physella acuta TaxID=109671 RepID=UPI0027DCFB75|nr:cholinesterase 1-like [Physella acuta]
MWCRVFLVVVAVWCRMLLLLLCPVPVLASVKRTVDRQTNYGTVRGLVDTLQDPAHKVEKFLGVPYARAPVGELRFEPPVPPERWQGIRPTQELSPACPQPRMGVEYIQMHVPEFNKTSEDCLYLNIFAPKVTDDRKRHAVLVFIHGGSYQNGMGAMIDGSHLAARDIVVVTFNYRLGPLGFLETNDDAFPGNLGLLDQLEALRWIQHNIHHFGGDPSRVTIDGHSAGGCSVGLLMLMPMAKGLFTRAIQQSGSPFADWAVTRHPAASNFYFKLFTAAVGCYGNGTAEVKKCLKQKSSEAIQKVIYDQPEHPVSLVPPFRPVVDGRVLPDTPERLAATGEINGQEILTGTTTDEGLIAADPLLNNFGVGRTGLPRLLAVMSGLSVDLPDIRSLIENVLEQYYRWPYDFKDDEIRKGFIEIVGDYFIAAPTQMTADLLVDRNVTVYFYNYDYSSVYDEFGGVIHGAELFYLSGYPITGYGNFRYDGTDQNMSEKLMQMWANFAQNGLPSLVPQEHFHMTPYTKASPVYTQITSKDHHVHMRSKMSFKTEKMEFWNRHVPNLYLNQLRKDVHLLKEAEAKIFKQTNISLDLMKRSSPYIGSHISGSWILIAACIGLSILTVLLSVCYCQVRRQVKTLIRQSSVSSGQPIL